jgi:hypothetical protein
MGKRRRRINNPKFAVKFSKTRETYHKLRGKAEDIVDNITETIEDVVDNVVESVEDLVEEIKEVFEEPKENPNALKFLNEEETIQIEEPKVEREIARPVTKAATVKKPVTTKKTITPQKPATTKKATTTKKTSISPSRNRTTKTKS